MANEARINCSLSIQKGNLDYRSYPTSFQGNVSGTKGPTPGAVTASVYGTLVDLSELSSPGYCRLMNVDDTNFVTIGVYDGTSFFPLLELLPGEPTVVRLSRWLSQEFAGTGTGTGSDVNQLMLQADTTECVVLVEAFES